MLFNWALNTAQSCPNSALNTLIHCPMMAEVCANCLYISPISVSTVVTRPVNAVKSVVRFSTLVPNSATFWFTAFIFSSISPTVPSSPVMAPIWFFRASYFSCRSPWSSPILVSSSPVAVVNSLRSSLPNVLTASSSLLLIRFSRFTNASLFADT